jgi:hypothetical protein
MTQATGEYMQSPHTIQQTVDETASPEDDLELVGRFTVAIIHSNKTYSIIIKVGTHL